MIMELSSNWKKLQAQLRKDPDGAASRNTDPANTLSARKRKALHDSSNSSNRKPSKRVKVPTKRATVDTKRAAKMGQYLSKASTDNAAQPQPYSTNSSARNSVASVNTTGGIPGQAGRYIAIDCEMVGTTSPAPFAVKSRSFHRSTITNEFDFSILARVTLISYTLEIVYDAYVLPPADVKISDYRTKYSGISAWHLNPANTTTNPVTFEVAQEQVARLLKDKILVGHGLSNDLKVLGLSHPRRDLRDTAKYIPYRAYAYGGPMAVKNLGSSRRQGGRLGHGGDPALRILAKEVLGWDIQTGEKGHDSTEDAKAAMELFKREKKGFEDAVAERYGRRTNPSQRAAEIATSNGKTNGAAHDDDEEASLDEPDEGSTAKSQKPRKPRKKKKKKGKYR